MGIGVLIMLGINAATHDNDICAALVDDLEWGAIGLTEMIGGDVEGDTGRENQEVFLTPPLMIMLLLLLLIDRLGPDPLESPLRDEANDKVSMAACHSYRLLRV